MSETKVWQCLTRGIMNEMKRRRSSDERVYCNMCGKDITEETRFPEIDVYAGSDVVLRVIDLCYDHGSPFFFKKTMAEAVEWARKSKKLEEIKVKTGQCIYSMPFEEHRPSTLFTYVDRDGKEALQCDCNIRRCSAFDD